MTEVIRDNWRFLLAALVLHAAIAYLLTTSFSSMNRIVVPSQLAIQARVIDQSAIRRVQERERRAEEDRRAKLQAEEEAKQRELEEAKQAEEKARLAEQQKLEQQKAEQQKVAQQKAQQLKAEQQKQVETAQREATARKQREQTDKQRAAEVQRKQKAEQDARAQSQRENELKQQLAEEEGRMQVRNSGMLNQYVALIEQHVIRHWNKPPSARSGIACEVKVTQAPGGTVLSATVGKCNGDQAVVQSIEAAVLRSSPLPLPPDPRLFERELLIIFKPNE